MTDLPDYTAIPMQVDPHQQRMRGSAVHGNTPFDVPFISHIEGNLYIGGCRKGLVLPDHILHVVSLYPWESYAVEHGLHSQTAVVMYDDADTPVPSEVLDVAEWAASRVLRGPTLIHCQAGLNRSGLVGALVLMLNGRTPQQAIDLIRQRRSPACLCNKAFVNYLHTVWEPPAED